MPKSSDANSLVKDVTPKWLDNATYAHVIPFLAWILGMEFFSHFPISDAVAYSLRSGLVIVFLAIFRPWRWYNRIKPSSIFHGLWVGVVVFIIWTLPEYRTSEAVSSTQSFYLHWLMRPLGRVTEIKMTCDYAPAECGYLFTFIRLAGSAFVIAVAEEFFFRGFLYRWLIDHKFTKVNLGKFVPSIFLFSCLLFGIEHHRWLAAIITAACYGFLVLKTKDIWAGVIAHVVTNLVLAIFVILAKQYQFWV